MTSKPDPQILAAFGAPVTEPSPLPGGQGTTWVAGDVVLKPVPDVHEAEWVADVLTAVSENGFRVSRPIRAAAGTWTTEGWTGWQRVSGEHDLANRWPVVLTVADAFHRALRKVPRPAFLDRRNDFWSVGDRAAWDDRTPDVLHHRLADLVADFDAFRSPSRLPSQVVHGDLTGNVLFTDGAAPAIIDFVPYWRPPAFAAAVVVADAIAWHDASLDLVDVLPHEGEARSLVARAAIYRLLTSDRAAGDRADQEEYLRHTQEAYRRVLTALRSM